MMQKLKNWWYFHMVNPVVREGHTEAFKWVFRRFWLEISTVSGNWKVRFTAAEHPYAYLLAGKTDDNIIGFCQMLYYLGMVLTTDQGLVDDIAKAISKYDKRLAKKASSAVKEDPEEEKLALEDVKQVQSYVEMDPKNKQKRERDINGRFKKAVKKIEDEEKDRK